MKRIYITESQLGEILKENQILLEAKTQVDNFDLIGDLINLTDPDKFFFVQIVKRWKDNKDKSGADAWRQQGRNAGTYHKGGDFGNFASGTAFKVRSKQELLALKPQIVKYCDANNARAYITSNPRSESQINNHLAKLQNKFGNKLNPWDQKFGFEHMAGQAKRYGPDWPDRVRLMLDIDTEKNTWYVPSSKATKFHTQTAKSGKSYIDDRGFPQLRGVEVRYAKHGAQTLIAKYPNQEASIKALGGINVWDYTHQTLQQNGIPVEKEYGTPSNGLHIIIADISKVQNLDQVEDDLRIFDDGVNENMTQLVHFNFDGKLILYSNVDTRGY